MTTKPLSQPDSKRPLISRVEDLPDFDAMSEEALIEWWETHDVTAEVMSTFPEGDIEEDLALAGLDPADYLKQK